MASATCEYCAQQLRHMCTTESNSQLEHPEGVLYQKIGKAINSEKGNTCEGIMITREMSYLG